MSIVVLIRWEITYAMHPYRFWSGSNINLRCENCSDQMCKIKKPLTGLVLLINVMGNILVQHIKKQLGGRKVSTKKWKCII